MKLYKSLTCIILATIAALLYVSMQVSQFEVSYSIRRNEQTIARLLDQNKVLRYNTFALKSPASLEKMLMAKNIQLQMPDRREVVEIVAAPKLVQVAALQKGKDLVLNFFAARLGVKTLTLR
jgi:hypothetical protein